MKENLLDIRSALWSQMSSAQLLVVVSRPVEYEQRDSIFKVSLMRPVKCLTALTIDVWIHCTTLFCTFKLVIHRTVWVMSLHHVPLCVFFNSLIFSTCVKLAPLLLPQVSSSQQNGFPFPCAQMSTQNESFVYEFFFIIIIDANVYLKDNRKLQ